MTFLLGGALLDGCVLAVLAQEDTYGYQLTQRLQKTADVSESTLYPVLRRLQKDAFLETYDSPHAGRNRRYYKITVSGREKLSQIQAEWAVYREKLNRLLLSEGGGQDE